jgi:hypothetical protein
MAKIKAELKVNRKVVLIVKDHKQKVLLMNVGEGQVEHFGKMGMPWLEFMIICHCPGFENVDGEEGRFQNDFIHENMQEPGIKVGRWIFTKAQTGKGHLDMHYSFVNTKFRAYIEDGNDITIKEDIL